jgi:serine/threonine protein phosphatase PrpC
MPLTLDACVAQNIGDRKEQQDRAGLFQHPRQKGLVLAVVADGVGGQTGGALAAGQVVLTLQNALEGYSPTGPLPEHLLRDAMNEAHQMIRFGRVLNEQDPNSTGVALFLRAGGDTMAASWAHCGDSRLYHMRGNQVLFRTTDHTYVQSMIQRGYMTPEQAAVHPRRNMLITSLGGEDAPLVDMGAANELRGGDNFLMCSDGLYAYFSETEMATIVATNSARKACELLIAGARARAEGHGDNCTVIVVKLVEPAAALPGGAAPVPPKGSPPGGAAPGGAAPRR